MSASSLLINLVFVLIILALFGCGKDVPQTQTESIQSSIIVGDLDWEEITSLRSSDPIFQAAKSVGDMYLGPFSGRCTAFLISSKVVMTNQHCVGSASAARGVTVAFKHLKGVPESGWDKVKCDKYIGSNKELDYALLECEGSPGSQYGKLELSSELGEIGEPIYVVQQNCDYYTDRDCDWSKKFSLGDITKFEEKEYVHNADTLGGSSGSPVLSKDTHKVVALHHVGVGGNWFGRGVENRAVPMWKIVQDIKRKHPQVLKDDSSSSSSGSSSSQSMEPNDSMSQAKTLSLGFTKKLAIDSKTDYDFFKVKLSRFDRLSASISFSHRKGDLDMYLLDSKGKVIDKSTSVKSHESVSKWVRRGTYYVVVIGYKGATGEYDLEIDH